MTGASLQTMIQQAIQTFLKEEILEDPQMEVSPVMPLMTGFLDSNGLMSLIEFLEETYGVKVSNAEVTRENFRTIEVLAGFVDAKRRVEA
jgi:acyl carrier protein